MTIPVSSSTQPTGRSREADQIYQQYVSYYGDINNKISAIDQLPRTSQSLPILQKDRNQLILLQQQLYPIYISQYNNSVATLASFQSACASIESQVLSAYNEALTTKSPATTTSAAPSPITVFTTNNPPPQTTTSSTSTSSTTSTTSSTPTTTTATTTTTQSTGRSPDASLIYSQYISYYTDINTKIGAIDQLPYNQRIEAEVVQDRAQLVALQKQLATVYTEQYNNSSATIQTFKTACVPIESAVTLTYNDAMNPTGTTPVITTTPTTTTPPPTTTTTSSTTTTTPTTSTSSTTPTTPVQPVSSAASPFKIENGTWYINWTSWNYPIPEGVNAVNIFVGNMHLDASGKPVIDGFGTMSQNYALMDAFIQGCHAKGITVKMSLGGGGGSYDNCWDALTSSNVQTFAQTLANFCHTHKADGVDFDCEEFTSGQDRPAQQALVGTFIKDFKTIDPSFQTSLDTNAGFGQYYPWPGVVQNILNGALSTDPATHKTTCAVDRLYIMSYYNTMADEQNWITGWANWLKTNYSFAPSQITVGLNSDSHAYDVPAFAAWAASKGYSTSYWDYDPANPTQSNQTTNAILNAYNSHV